MNQSHLAVSSGIEDLDRLLGGGLFIGDNVVWYDDAGSLAPVFCHNFIRRSLADGKALIYVNFDHIIEKEAHSQRLRARINQIAQVVIALAVNRGKTRLTLVKAEGHDSERLEEDFLARYGGRPI